MPLSLYNKRRKVLLVLISLLAVLTSMTQFPLVTVNAELPTSMPVVYVEPQTSYAAEGTRLNVSTTIFNLTNTFYQTDILWHPGNPLPPPGTLYNYSLGNLYGFNISFSWNPEVLEYIKHSIKSPVEVYPEGILHGPVVSTQDDVNPTAGTYTIAQNSYPLVKSFNCHNSSATVFTITFEVKREEACVLRLERVELILDPILDVQPGVLSEIPHIIIDGVFVPEETIRITALNIGYLHETDILKPVIAGENATAKIQVRGQGDIISFYNLTLFDGSTRLRTWRNQNLTPGEKRTYNFTWETRDSDVGSHVAIAKARISHRNQTVLDTFTRSFQIIKTPMLHISRTINNINVNETVTFSAANSIHQDPKSLIQYYRWAIYRNLEVLPSFEYEGITATHTFEENGTWRIELTVKDNWGIVYDITRDATEPYLEELIIDVHTVDISPDPLPLTPEQLALLVIFILLATFGLVKLVTRKKDATSYL